MFLNSDVKKNQGVISGVSPEASFRQNRDNVIDE